MTTYSDAYDVILNLCAPPSDLDTHGRWFRVSPHTLLEPAHSLEPALPARRSKLRSDGKFSVGETLHGYPFLGTGSPIPGVGGAYSSDGQGGAAPNHMHWHVIAIEPHLKMDARSPDVVNQLHVVTAAANSFSLRTPVAAPWQPPHVSSSRVLSDHEMSRHTGWHQVPAPIPRHSAERCPQDAIKRCLLP